MESLPYPAAARACPPFSRAPHIPLLQIVVERLQNRERSLPSSILADQALAIPAVLHVGQNPARGAEVGEDPRGHAPPGRDLAKHGDGLAIQVLLVFLAEAGERIRVPTLQRKLWDLARYLASFLSVSS